KEPVEQGIQEFKNTVNGTVTDQAADAPFQAMEEAPTTRGSSDVQKIAQENNWPVLEGMVSNNRDVKMAEDSLLNGAPTIAGIGRRKLYSDALDSVTNSVDNAINSTSDMSETQVGNVLKDSLNQKLSAQYEPIKQLYDAIEPYRQAIPVSLRSTGSLSRNVEKIIEDQGLVPGTNRYNFVKTFADGIANVDNLQKLANFRTEIGKSAGPETKDLAGLISDKLNGAEERAVQRYAETMKTPVAKDKIMSLIDQAKQAKSGYSQFRGKLQELGNSIGKKKIYGPQNFMDFLDNLNPQSLTRRLFNENNTEFADYFAKEFPDEMKSMRDYQRAEIKREAMKGGQFNAKAAIKNIQSMEPEMKKLLFSQDELKTLDQAGKYIDAFPKSFNPSGTAHESAF